MFAKCVLSMELSLKGVSFVGLFICPFPVQRGCVLSMELSLKGVSVVGLFICGFPVQRGMHVSCVYMLHIYYPSELYEMRC